LTHRVPVVKRRDPVVWRANGANRGPVVKRLQAPLPPLFTHVCAAHTCASVSNLRQIARTLEIRCFTNDTVVFLQNAPPDAYYIVLHGAVSIYFKHPTAERDMTMPEARRDYGKFLVQLKKPAGFGELSFQSDFNHTARNAGVVADGDGDGTDYTTASVGHDTEWSSSVPTASPLTSPDGTMNHRMAPGVCVLLLIPEKTYMSEMYALHASKNQTKDKINLLKKNFLFMSWSIDQLVKLAYGMKKRVYKKNESIVLQGGKSDHGESRERSEPSEASREM